MSFAKRMRYLSADKWCEDLRVCVDEQDISDHFRQSFFKEKLPGGLSRWLLPQWDWDCWPYMRQMPPQRYEMHWPRPDHRASAPFPSLFIVRNVGTGST